MRRSFLVFIGILGFALAVSADDVSIAPPAAAPAPAAAASNAPAETPASPGLVADDTHSVAVIPECDLAIRYPKATSVPVRFFLNEGKPYFNESPERSIQIYEDMSASDSASTPGRLYIECIDNLHYTNSKDGLFGPTFGARYRLAPRTISPNHLCEEAELDSEACRASSDPQQFMATDRNSGASYSVFVWKMGRATYFLGRRNDAEKRVAIELQMDSLAPSKSSIDLNDPALKDYHW